MREVRDREEKENERRRHGGMQAGKREGGRKGRLR